MKPVRARLWRNSFFVWCQFVRGVAGAVVARLRRAEHGPVLQSFLLRLSFAPTRIRRPKPAFVLCVTFLPLHSACVASAVVSTATIPGALLIVPGMLPVASFHKTLALSGFGLLVS